MSRASLTACIGAVLLSGLAADAAAFLPVREWADGFEDGIENMTLLEGLLAFAAAYLVVTLLLLPAWILSVVAGAAFGFAWGSIATLAASTLSAIAAFLVARHVLRKPIERRARRNTTFKAVDKAVEKEAWKVVALLRLSPVLPSSLKSYFLGVTRVGLADYTTATLIGTAPGILLRVYVGATGRQALTHGSPITWTLLAVGICATVAVTIIVGRLARRRLKAS